ncbi:MAG: phage terminase small subunit P27 family [Planctomycetota bacterium]
MAGRPPKPTKTKRLEGNPGKRKLNTAEPTPPNVAPPCPKFLIGESLNEWKRIIPLLEEMDLLAKADLGTISTYCQSYGQFFDAQQKLNTQELTIFSCGQILPNPLIAIVRNAQKSMMTAANQLGLTPSARSRIHIEKVERPSDTAKDFAAKRGD